MDSLVLKTIINSRLAFQKLNNQIIKLHQLLITMTKIIGIKYQQIKTNKMCIKIYLINR